jgi:hypothetical protein
MMHEAAWHAVQETSLALHIGKSAKLPVCERGEGGEKGLQGGMVGLNTSDARAACCSRMGSRRWRGGPWGRGAGWGEGQ